MTGTPHRHPDRSEGPLVHRARGTKLPAGPARSSTSSAPQRAQPGNPCARDERSFAALRMTRGAAPVAGRFAEFVKVVALHLLLIALAFIALVPFLWLVCACFKTQADIFAYP